MSDESWLYRSSQKYEFRSLIPAAHIVPQKEINSFDVVTVNNNIILEKLQFLIQDSVWVKKSIVLSTDSYGKLVIGFLDQIYSIDSKIMDCSEFVSYLLDSDVEIVWYELKTDLKRLYAIQKPSKVKWRARKIILELYSLYSQHPSVFVSSSSSKQIIYFNSWWYFFIWIAYNCNESIVDFS